MPTQDHNRADENENLKHFKLFQNEEVQTREQVMDDFLDWLDHEFDVSKENRDDLQNLVNLFVGYDIKRAKQGEQILLERWNK